MNRRVAEFFDVYRLDVRTGAMHAIARIPEHPVVDHRSRRPSGAWRDHRRRRHLDPVPRDGGRTRGASVATYNFKESATPCCSRSTTAECMWRRRRAGPTACSSTTWPPGREGRLVFDTTRSTFTQSAALAGAPHDHRRGVRDRPPHYASGRRPRQDAGRARPRLPGTFNSLCRTRSTSDGYVVHAARERSLGYWYWDVTPTGLDHLFECPRARRARHGRGPPVTYAARDGLRIRGYLTLPAGVANSWGCRWS